MSQLLFRSMLVVEVRSAGERDMDFRIGTFQNDLLIHFNRQLAGCRIGEDLHVLALLHRS